MDKTLCFVLCRGETYIQVIKSYAANIVPKLLRSIPSIFQSAFALTRLASDKRQSF